MNKKLKSLLALHQNLPTVYSKIRSAKCAVILDIDETVLSCMEKWQEYVKSELNIQLSLKQIKQAGSVDNLFINNPNYSDFTKWADKLLKMPHLELGGYLTARPRNVKKVTLNNLQEIGFPSLPIIGRPSTMPYLSSVKWKLSVLDDLQNIYNGILLMIDDSAELALEIQASNNTSKYIVIILIKTPYNHVQIRREGIITNMNHHMYVTNWSKVPSICAKYI
jgi:hypothetical protein